MSLRTVALDTPRLCRSTSVFEPIGSLVDTKSATMARSTSKRRSSALPNCSPALRSESAPILRCINRGNTARAVVCVADGQVVYDQSVSSNSDKWSAPPLSGVIWSGPLVRYERQFPLPSGWFHQHAWGAGRRRRVGGRWWLGPVVWWSGDHRGDAFRPSGRGSPPRCSRGPRHVQIKSGPWHVRAGIGFCVGLAWLSPSAGIG